MQPVQRVVICGSSASVFLMAIEASLAARPEVEVIRLDPHLPKVVDHITALDPQAIMIERGSGQGDLALELLDRGLPLIEMNADQGHVTVLTGRQVSITQAGELTQVIERIAQELPEPSASDRIDSSKLS